jgi:ring-1,2-phenylacetyl-CoA epoxidase subunit PaaE
MAPPRFHPLTISAIAPEAKNAVSLCFDVPDALRAAYQFTPGQYLTLRHEIDGAEQRRAYSICAAPDDAELRIAVKRVADGVMSSYLCDQARVGDTVDVMTPTGRFGLAPDPARARQLVAFAAGSGITPILSILRSVLGREPDSHCALFYANRTTDEIMFRETLEALKNRHLGRFALLNILSREEQDIPILHGRLDAARIESLLNRAVPGRIDDLFICGPEPMIDIVESAAHAHGVATDAIHVERFVSSHGGTPRASAALPRAPEIDAVTITIIADGKHHTIPIGPEEAILDAALRAGLDLPYACKGGMCATCRARLIGGHATMAVNYSLADWEVKAGFVLSCQARIDGAGVVVDYDAQ